MKSSCLTFLRGRGGRGGKGRGDGRWFEVRQKIFKMAMKIRMRNEKRSGGFVKETFKLFDMDCLKDQGNGIRRLGKV